MTREERLRLANKEPLTLDVIWVPTSLCPDLYIHDLSNVPLNDILQEDYGLSLVRAVESIEPRTADAHMSKLLAIGKEELLIHVEQTVYTEDGKIAYFATSSYRGDRVKFSIELKSG